MARGSFKPIFYEFSTKPKTIKHNQVEKDQKRANLVHEGVISRPKISKQNTEELRNIINLETANL